jgi:penicillin amidase
MIQPGKTYTLEDHRRMQLDAVSLRAQSEQSLFQGWTSAVPDVERARRMLAEWDAVLSRESAGAALYSAWRAASTPQERDLARPIAERRPLLETSLTKAIEQLKTTQGADWATWRWGRMHTQAFPHPFVAPFDLPPIERRGGTGTVAADGATYREILDVSNWDRSLVTNVPGQSGQPESPFYGSLLPLFSKDAYFPLVFSQARVEQEAAHKLTLKPKGN